jgi:transposase
MTELQSLRKDLEAAVKPGHGEVVDRLLDLLERQLKRCDALEKQAARLEAENARLQKRIAELEGRKPPSSGGTGGSIDYSLAAEEKRRQRKQLKRRLKAKKKKPGRKPKKDKLDSVVRWRDIVPSGLKKQDCDLQSERLVWRIEDGKAIRMGYRVYRAAWGETPRVPGVLPRCEYGVEIHVLLAHLVYITGVSIEKACQLLSFFCELPLERSQADAMLNQLGDAWASEFEEICEQLTMAAVVYSDETSWRIGRLNTSLWSFTSELQCVMLYGCSKDRVTLESILPPGEFQGCLVSDDAAVYREGYRSQKCWAHLIRKVVKLVLLNPNESKYRDFLDKLLKIFHDAKRVAKDRRMREQGRQKHESRLVAKLCDVCHPHWLATSPQLPEPCTESERTFYNLIEEFMRLVAAEQLFEFVRHPEVDPTNNLSERQLRSSALARKAKRTNKTDAGAKRQTHIVSVLQSLRRSLPTFTIKTVLERVENALHHAGGIFQTSGPTAENAV